MAIPFTIWRNGSGDWLDVSPAPDPAPGWGNGMPNLATDAMATVQDITITYSLAGGVARSLSMQGPGIGLNAHSATLAISGGSLLLGTTSPVGNVVMTGGLLEFGNALVMEDGTLDFDHAGLAGLSSQIFNLDLAEGATIKVQSGILQLAGDSVVIAGTITDDDRTDAGRSRLEVSKTVSGEPGNIVLKSTAVLDIAAFAIVGVATMVTLESDRTYGGVFEQGGQTDLQLAGHTFTLSGEAALGGAVHGGTLRVTSTGTSNALTIVDGASVVVEGAIVAQNGFGNWLDIGVGSSAGTLTIAEEGAWTIVGDYGATLSEAGLLDIAGLFEKTAGSRSVVSGGTVNSTGTIRADAGTVLDFTGGRGMIGGHVTGEGEIGLHGDYTLAGGVDLDVAVLRTAGTGVTLTLGGDLSYAGDYTQGAALNLAGNTMTLEGTALIGGAVTDGTLRLDGTATMTGTTFSDDAILEVNGDVVHTAGFFTLLVFGATATDASGLRITETGTWSIQSSAIGINLWQAATLGNEGVLEKTDAGRTVISGGIISSTGTIDAEGSASVLAFSGGTGTFGGHLTGAGQITLDGTYTLAAGVVLDVARFGTAGSGVTLTLGGDLAYGGAYSQAATLRLGGHDFTLSGTATIAGAVEGGGRLVLDGATTLAATTFQNGAAVDVDGTLTQTASIRIGNGAQDTAGATIDAGAAWSIAANADIILSAGATFTNDGSFRKTAGALSSVSGGTIDSSGTVGVDAGVLTFASGTGIFDGSLTGSGELVFNGTYSFADGAIGDVATLRNSGTLMLGAAAGDAVAIGSTSRATEFQNAGTVVQHADLALRGQLTNVAGRTYTLASGDIAGNGATIMNDGLFDRTGAAGTSAIEAAFTNNGRIAVHDGSLVFSDLDNIGIIQGVIATSGDLTTVSADAAGELTLTGGSGDNRFDLAAAPTSLDGGAGIDTLVITANMAFGAGSVRRVEKVEINGNVGADLSRLTDAMEISLSASFFGAASVTGTRGADTIISAFGGNFMNGGEGNDTFIVQSFGDVVVEAEGAGNDHVRSAVGFTLGANVEKLTLTGTQDNFASGSAEANTIIGNSGSNMITGFGGKDKLTGGGGADTFFFYAGDTGRKKSAADVILDFTGDDHIDLSAIDAVTRSGKDNAFDFIGTHAFTRHAGELRYEKTKSDTWIQGDMNGDGKADLMIHLDDAMKLKAADFEL